MKGTLTSGGCLGQESTLQRTPRKATSMCTASEEGRAAPHTKTAPVTSVTGIYTSDSSHLRVKGFDRHQLSKQENTDSDIYGLKVIS